MGVENDFYIASQYRLPHTCLYANVKVLVKRKKPKIQMEEGKNEFRHRLFCKRARWKFRKFVPYKFNFLC